MQDLSNGQAPADTSPLDSPIGVPTLNQSPSPRVGHSLTQGQHPFLQHHHSGGPRLPSLPAQWYSGNPLDRTLSAKRSFDGGVLANQEVCLVVVSGREVAYRTQFAEDDQGAPLSIPHHDLQVLLLSAADPQLDLNSETICLVFRPDEDSEVEHRLPLYLLGQDTTQRWTFALDISGPQKTSFLGYLRSACGLPDVQLADLRSLMPTLSQEACAIAGQAAALSQWHLTHRFCPRCGARTLATESGQRRRCESDHKVYPRTDPVVIMLVESPDGHRALLGRSRKFMPGMYTCLSGFIDQCEAVEEAVRREVREEAHVTVAEVQIQGTQPWPIGRYGSCELMLGCMAKAKSYEILVNTNEMEDVQWFDRSELQAAVSLYDNPAEGMTIEELQQTSMQQLGFFLPPPMAIAFSLVRLWANHGQPWFPSTPGTIPSAGPSGSGPTPSNL